MDLEGTNLIPYYWQHRVSDSVSGSDNTSALESFPLTFDLKSGDRSPVIHNYSILKPSLPYILHLLDSWPPLLPPGIALT